MTSCPPMPFRVNPCRHIEGRDACIRSRTTLDRGRRPVCWPPVCWRHRRQRRPSARGLARRSPTSSETHVVRLGYRESSPPFSFLDQSNRPIGYSLELCEAIVEEIGVEVDDANLKIEYVKVTSDDRIPAVTENKIDLECGSTTANAERAKLVAFSPLIFVAGTKLMVPKASTISAPTDLKGKTVVVTKGTTNEQAMHTHRQEVLARPEHRDIARSRAILPDAGGRQGRRVRDRRHPALRPDRAAQGAGQVQGHRRISVLRSLRHHVPQGRAAVEGRGRAHLPASSVRAAT